MISIELLLYHSQVGRRLHRRGDSTKRYTCLERGLRGGIDRNADQKRRPDSLPGIAAFILLCDRVADDVRQGRRLEYKSRRKVGLTIWGRGGGWGRGLWARLLEGWAWG